MPGIEFRQHGTHFDSPSSLSLRFGNFPHLNHPSYLNILRFTHERTMFDLRQLRYRPYGLLEPYFGNNT